MSAPGSVSEALIGPLAITSVSTRPANNKENARIVDTRLIRCQKGKIGK